MSDAEDALLMIDVLTVKQQCTPVTVAFDDTAVADLFDAMVDQGIPPERFGRVWIHTHPGECPRPSPTDEATFRRVFGHTDWAVMAILAAGGATYARLSFHTGPGGRLKIPVAVDFSRPFRGSDVGGWESEYLRHVTPAPRFISDAADSGLDAQFSELGNWGDLEDDGIP